ncbi:hypothetical protein GCM10027072_04570 [Streptomyces bullii]
MSGDKAAQISPVFTGRRWFFPSALLHEPDPGTGQLGPCPRRTVRDWVVDFSCFLLAVVVGVLSADALPDNPDLPYALIVVDQWIGALACAAVWLRRRWPLGLAVRWSPSVPSRTPRAA